MIEKKSDRFLSAFNQVDKWMKKQLNPEGFMSFSHALSQLKQSNVVIKRYYDDLKVFSDLRNAIVHEKVKEDFVIAEPHSETVEKIESIRDDLLQPKPVYPEFKREVIMFDIRDNMSIVLKTIKDKRISQFPIFEKGFIKGLLTENGITSWLSRNIENDIVSFSETTIEDVLLCEEDNNNYLFIPKGMSVYETKEIYKERIENGNNNLDAILITENGNQDEFLLGIITSWDLVNI